MEKLRCAEKVSVIIPTMKGREKLLDRLISSIPKGYEIITVDNDDMLLAEKRNWGASRSRRRYLLFIDDDNYLGQTTIEMAVESLEKYGGVIGLVAGYSHRKKRVSDGGSNRNYLTGFTKGRYTNEFITRLPDGCYEVDEVANAFMMRRQLWRRLGGFDEKNFPIDLDEADFCKRVKDIGYKIRMNPEAICYHKSYTYSQIPNFRRPLNAYCMGNHRIRFQRKHLSGVRFSVYLGVFLPVFVGFYAISLIWQRNPKMILPFLHGVLDGLRNRRTNRYK